MNPAQTDIVFGIRALSEAIRNKKNIETVYLQKDTQGKLFQDLFSLIRKKQISFQFVPKVKLDRLVNEKHQGVVARISPVSYYNIDDLLKSLEQKKEPSIILVLDRITDVRNFGAIARTAECAGVAGIIIPNKNSAKINPQAIKTSAGALYTIPVCRELNLKNIVKKLKYSGFKIAAATEKATKNYTDVDFTTPTVIIMGSEEKGIDDNLLRHAHETVRIPLKGNIESLNVSVATAVILFEALKQKNNKKA